MCSSRAVATTDRPSSRVNISAARSRLICTRRTVLEAPVARDGDVDSNVPHTQSAIPVHACFRPESMLDILMRFMPVAQVTQVLRRPGQIVLAAKSLWMAYLLHKSILAVGRVRQLCFFSFNGTAESRALSKLGIAESRVPFKGERDVFVDAMPNPITGPLLWPFPPPAAPPGPCSSPPDIPSPDRNQQQCPRPPASTPSCPASA